jgi:hypothetical protein
LFVFHRLGSAVFLLPLLFLYVFPFWNAIGMRRDKTFSVSFCPQLVLPAVAVMAASVESQTFGLLKPAWKPSQHSGIWSTKRFPNHLFQNASIVLSRQRVAQRDAGSTFNGIAHDIDCLFKREMHANQRRAPRVFA